MRSAKRVLVVGFDGATWDTLSRYAHDGTMPTLGKLRSESTWGALRSTIPPVTAPAWAALSTGKNPGKTGIYAFYTPVDSIDRFRPITSLDVHAETLPELLEGAGLRVAVINLPTFSYPKKIRGPVLGDILCPPDMVVQPRTLLEKEVFKRYRSFPNMSLKHHPVRYVQDIRDLELARFNCAKELFQEQWDFMFVMFSGVDWIQHELYHSLVRSTNSAPVSEALSFFRDLDGYLKWFVAQLGPQDYFFLVSDHGFKTSEKAFSVNQWLLRNGYIRTKAGTGVQSGFGRNVGFQVPRVLLTAISRHRRLWRLSLGAWRAAMGSSGLAENLRPNPRTSVAFSQDYTWGIRLNSKRHFEKGILDEEQEAEVLVRLRERMDELSRSGVIERCLLGSEVYSGAQAANAPDLVIFPAAGSTLAAQHITRGDRPHSGHSMDGVYLMKGPGIPSGEGGRASICDITPTVLTLFGQEVAADSDGSTLTGEAKTRSVDVRGTGEELRLSGEDEQLIEERLRSLGYV